MKYGNINLLELPRPVQGCTGNARKQISIRDIEGV
jgi:hypothetical protein